MKDSQTRKILEYMRVNGSITQMDALKHFGCMRLAARIADIRRDGTPVHTEIVEDKSPNGSAVRYARYSLGDANG